MFYKALDDSVESEDERLLQLKVDPRFEVKHIDQKLLKVLRKVNLEQ